MIDRRKRNILITIIVLLGIASDQISKVWVRNNFESYIEKSIIGDVFTLIKVENTGAFLGMGSELSEIPRILNNQCFDGEMSESAIEEFDRGFAMIHEAMIQGLKI